MVDGGADVRAGRQGDAIRAGALSCCSILLLVNRSNFTRTESLRDSHTGFALIRFWSVYIDAGNTNTEFGGFSAREDMKPAKYVSILLAVFAFCSFTAAQSLPNTQALDDGRQWLDSRNLPTPTAPALVRAAAANARNQSAVSEKLL
jgi:hypothetical protein